MIVLLFRDAIIIFPEESVTATVSIKFTKFTTDQLSEIFPEIGQNITVWLDFFFFFLIKLSFFRRKKN